MNISVLTIFNVTITAADTEFSQAVHEYASYFEIKARQITSELKLAFVSGASGTTYFSIPQGGVWFAKGKISGLKTLYFQSPQTGTVVEIIQGY